MPFGGHLNKRKRWVSLAELIPWEDFEEQYAEHFVDYEMGAPAKSFLMVLGALLIKEKLGITDIEMVEQIRENPYLQFLIGMEGYRDEAPFEATIMVHFRKRITPEMLAEINDRIHTEQVKKLKAKKETEEKEEAEVENKGKLLVDATCVPADIRYPTDLNLLNEAREKIEDIIDALHRQHIGTQKKVRIYR